MTDTIIHVGDVGTTFRLKILHPNDVETYGDLAGTPIDVSGANVKTFYFMKPDKTKHSVTAEFESDGADGKLVYTTIEDDIDAVGKWQVQAYVEIGASKYFSTKAVFSVNGNLA